MTYDRHPAGLRWDDHYVMANAVFYACVETLAQHTPAPARAEREPEKEPVEKRKHRKVEAA